MISCFLPFVFNYGKKDLGCHGIYYKDSPLGSRAPHPPLGYPVPGERRPQIQQTPQDPGKPRVPSPDPLLLVCLQDLISVLWPLKGCHTVCIMMSAPRACGSNATYILGLTSQHVVLDSCCLSSLPFPPPESSLLTPPTHTHTLPMSRSLDTRRAC